VASVDRWANFCDKWQRLCEQYFGGKAFTLSPGTLSDSTLAKFAECIVEHVETEIWTAAPEYYLDKIRAKYDVRYDRYRVCFHGLLDSTVNRLRDEGDSLEWWFAHPEGASGDDPRVESQISLFRAFADARSLLTSTRKRLLHSLAFADYESVLPLQAAAFLVEHKRRYHSTPLDARVDPAYSILREASLNRIELVWFDHTLEDSLNRLTAAEKGN
jgi:hypothetical protein